MNKMFKFVCALTIALSLLLSMAIWSVAVGEDDTTSANTDTTAAEDTTASETTTDTDDSETTSPDSDTTSSDTTTESGDVTVELIGISFASEFYIVTVNETCSTKILFTPAEAEVSEITYSSADESIAKIDKNGVIKGVSAGETTVTATYKELSCTVEVTVCELSLKEEQDSETSETFLIGFTPKMSVSDAKELVSAYKGVDASSLTFYKGDATCADEDKITTGTVISDALGTKYSVVILGDVNGDGEVTYDDTKTVVDALTGVAFANSACKKAASLAGEEVLTIKSALAISDYIRGQNK